MKSRPKSQQQLPLRRIPVHELFPQPGNPPMTTRPERAPVGRNHKPAGPRIAFPKKNILWAMVFFGFILSCFGLYGALRRGETQTPYVLLEIRALDDTGHPVTAADVIVNQKKMGVTDSFGEWRRYLQLHPGDDVKIELNKRGTINLIGTKNAVVPNRSQSKQDIELQVAITLKNPRAVAKVPVASKEGESLKDRDAGPEKMKPRDTPVLENEDAFAADDGNEHREVQAKAKESNPPKNADYKAVENSLGDTNEGSMGVYFDDGLNRISVSSSLGQAKPSNLMDKRQQDVVRERVLPVLVNDLQSLGLSVDRNSPWKLALSYVPNGEQVGYIRAEIEWHSPFGQTEKSSFIAGFAKTYEETGRGLASLLRLHMKKTYWAFKENGNWFIDETQQTKDFWRLKPGSVVTDTSGEKFPIAMAAQAENGNRWKMKIGKTQPCEAVRQRTRCMVSTESLKEAPPLAGWVMKRVRILGPVPTNADVYVAGFQAHAVGNGQWEFWSHSGSNLKALILQGGRIIHSEAFTDNPGEAIVLKMAAVPLKNKAH